MAFSDSEFNALFSDIYGGLCVFAYRMVWSRDVAEDVAADAFAALWDRRKTIADAPRARMFLFRAARNAALNHIRDERGRENILAGRAEQGSVPGASAYMERVSMADPDAAKRAISDVVAAMPEMRRSVFSLRWEQDMTHAQIAEVLGIAKKTVEMHLSLAMKELREKLGP